MLYSSGAQPFLVKSH